MTAEMRTELGNVAQFAVGLVKRLHMKERHKSGQAFSRCQEHNCVTALERIAYWDAQDKADAIKKCEAQQ